MDIKTNVFIDSNSALYSPYSSDGSLTASAFSESRALITPVSGRRPSQLLSSGINDDSLKAHRSSLPLPLYLLSFAPPIRGERKYGSYTASWRDFFAHPYVLYILGALAAIPAGLAFPAQDLLYGYWATGVTATDATSKQITTRGNQTGWVMAVAGFVILFLAWAFLACCELNRQLTEVSFLNLAFLVSAASHALTERLRQAYVAAVIVQDAAFFEKTGPGEISTRVSKDMTAIRTAFGEKLGYLIWSLSTVIAVSHICLSLLCAKLTVSQSIVPSLVNSPKLGGVLFAVIPFVLIMFGFLVWANDIVGGPVSALEGQASSLAEQILSSVRIVQSFNMGESIIKRFDGDLLKRLQRLGAKRSVIRSLEQSSVYFTLFLTYSLTFWFGGIQVREGLQTGHVLTVRSERNATSSI